MATTVRATEPSSATLGKRLRAGGIVADPATVIAEAQRAGLRLAIACAVLEKESGGGQNVFGHDPTIFVGAGLVTRAKYTAYRKARIASGNRRMQGVGPCQLTWYEFQDEADRLGGCWLPAINMRVGFGRLAASIKSHGESDGLARYYGAGKAATTWSQDVMAKMRAWEQRIAGLAAAGPDATAVASAGREGIRGPTVERLTRRLSYVRAPATGKPYLDHVRRRLDEDTRRALKAFQQDHDLLADGTLGPLTARALSDAVRRQRAGGTSAAAAAAADLATLARTADATATASRAADERLIERGRLLIAGIEPSEDLDPGGPARLLRAATADARKARAALTDRVTRLDKLRQPYPGPRPFDHDEAPLFFGRDREVAQLRSMILAHSLVLLYGESGAGKTSLLRAGLIPRLLESKGTTVFPIVRVQPTGDPSLAPEVENPYMRALVANWAGEQKHDPLHDVTDLASFVAVLREAHGAAPDEPHVLIIDQFEELFTTLPASWDRRDDFFEQLQHGLDEDSALRIVLSMREDFVAETDPYSARVRNRLQHRFRIRRLRADAAYEAVTRPLEPTGYSFAPEAAAHLVNQLLLIKVGAGESRGEFVEPVQLQIVCASLWDRVLALPEAVQVIETAHLMALAPVDRALGDFYDALIERVAQEQRIDRAVLRRWCEDKLITSGGTRAPAYKGDTETEGMANAVVERLAAEHLLRGDSRAGGYWYELSHDKFVEPIRASNRVALEHEIDQVALFSEYVNTRSESVLAALAKVTTGTDASRRDALRTIEAAVFSGAPLSGPTGAEMRRVLSGVARDKTATESLRREAELVLLAADDEAIGASAAENPMRTRVTMRSLLTRRIHWGELVLALMPLLVALFLSTLALLALTRAVLDADKTPESASLAVAVAIVSAVWIAAYALETVANFPLASFRRSANQFAHTISAPWATWSLKPKVLLVLPLNVALPWATGAAAGALAVGIVGVTSDATFVVVTTLVTVGVALVYRDEA